MEKRFASIRREGIAYEVLSYDQKIETWQARGGYLSPQIAEYQCYNDGLVRHSYPSLVYGDNIVDCLASLAVFVFDNKDNADLMKLLDSIWPSDIYHDRVNFALTVKFNPDKRKYYNMDDLKIGTSEKLQYDTRWTPVPDTADGSLDSICALLIPYYHDALHKFYYYNQLRDHNGIYGNIKGCLVGIPGETYESETNIATSALRITDCLVKAERLRRQAERQVESLNYNMTREKEKVAA